MRASALTIPLTLHCFELQALLDAAKNVGFFNLKNHGLPEADIKQMFSTVETFFALPDEDKQLVPVDPDTYLGWEKNAEISPATGVSRMEQLAWLTHCCIIFLTDPCICLHVVVEPLFCR